MRQVIIRECPPYVMEETIEIPIELPAAIYQERVGRLRKRMDEEELDAVILYGDREHFANIEYFSRYDCRFEEALFIVRRTGDPVMITGNEGRAYCRNIPYSVKVLYYGYFSLQGQPLHEPSDLKKVLEEAGIYRGMRVGLAGYKYYQNDNLFDVPEYIVVTLRDYLEPQNLCSFTKSLTGLPNGLRMTLQSMEEILVINYRAAKVANVIRRLLKAVKPGISELELSQFGKIDFAPQQTYSMVNFGRESVSMGIRSPSPLVCLKPGGPMSIAFSQRGSLMCRAAFAAENLKMVDKELRPMLNSHIMPYWKAVVAWYETVKVGRRCGDVFAKVNEIIGDSNFGFELNPGHYIGGDEWVNTAFSPDSEIEIHSGSHIQCDIIAASSSPVLSAICEDTVIIAGYELRQELKRKFPELYEKILKRQEFMREILGIQLNDDVLPMSILNSVMFPFMMNTGQMFAMQL